MTLATTATTDTGTSTRPMALTMTTLPPKKRMPDLHPHDDSNSNSNNNNEADNDELERMRAVLEGALRAGEYEYDSDDNDENKYNDHHIDTTDIDTTDIDDRPNVFVWLKQHPQLLTRTNENGETLLHIACDDLVPVAPSILLRLVQPQHNTIPSHLLHSALCQTTPVSYYTPLHLALESSMESRTVLRALMRAGPQAVGKLDWSHETALHKLFLYYYDDDDDHDHEDVPTNSTSIPNDIKPQPENDDLFSIPFLEKIVDANPGILNVVSDGDGTLLHICCKHHRSTGAQLMMRWLIHHPSVGNPTVALLRRNRKGLSPLEVAIRHGHPMVPELLRLCSREFWSSLLSHPAMSHNHNTHNNQTSNRHNTATKMNAAGGGGGGTCETTLLHHAARWCVQQQGRWLSDNHNNDINNNDDNHSNDHETLLQFMSLFPATAWLQVDRHGLCPLFTARQAYQQRYQQQYRHHHLTQNNPTNSNTNSNSNNYHHLQSYHRQWLRWMRTQTIHAASALLDCLADHPRVALVAVAEDSPGRKRKTKPGGSRLAPDQQPCHPAHKLAALVGQPSRSLGHPGRTVSWTRNELQTLIQPVGIQQLLTDPQVSSLLDGIVAMQHAAAETAGRPPHPPPPACGPSSAILEDDRDEDTGLDILAAVRDNPSCLWLHLVEHPCLLKRRNKKRS